jgi:DNA topoisomerase VI subunit A
LIPFRRIHPSDIETLDVAFVDMTAAELKKVDELLERPYMNPQLERELQHMKSRKIKAEIESIYHYSVEYLIRDYIPRKISAIEMPMERISQQVCDAKEEKMSV